eukprot:SAG22_NODE_1362_length_4618_cov_3.277495_3_plen_432_part_00
MRFSAFPCGSTALTEDRCNQRQAAAVKLCSVCGSYAPDGEFEIGVVENLHFGAGLRRQKEVPLAALLKAAGRVEQPPDYRCHCGSLGTTKRCSGLTRCPEVYVAAVNRVSHSRGVEGKLTTVVDFPDTLSLTPRLLYPDQPARDYSGRVCTPQYKLFAGVFHQGTTVTSGHYFAVVATPAAAGDPNDDEGAEEGGGGGGSVAASGGWTRISDTHIDQVESPQAVERQARATCALLFYKRLPAGWRVGHSRFDGAEFYVDQRTGAAQWHWPEEAATEDGDGDCDGDGGGDGGGDGATAKAAAAAADGIDCDYAPLGREVEAERIPVGCRFYNNSTVEGYFWRLVEEEPPESEDDEPEDDGQDGHGEPRRRLQLKMVPPSGKRPVLMPPGTQWPMRSFSGALSKAPASSGPFPRCLPSQTVPDWRLWRLTDSD